LSLEVECASCRSREWHSSSNSSNSHEKMPSDQWRPGIHTCVSVDTLIWTQKRNILSANLCNGYVKECLSDHIVVILCTFHVSISFMQKSLVVTLQGIQCPGWRTPPLEQRGPSIGCWVWCTTDTNVFLSYIGYVFSCVSYFLSYHLTTCS